MSVFTMVVWIVLICVAGSIWSKHLKHKQKAGQYNNDEMDRLRTENQQLHEDLKQLKERVQVLETIVTDEGYEIKKTINGL